MLGKGERTGVETGLEASDQTQKDPFVSEEASAFRRKSRHLYGDRKEWLAMGRALGFRRLEIPPPERYSSAGPFPI